MIIIINFALRNHNNNNLKITIMKYGTNYKVAAHWLNNNLIMCNEIQNDMSIYDNMRFGLEDEEGHIRDIYQYYLTDCSCSDVEYLEKTFGLLFTYSDNLDLFILCVDHFGTSWDYVYCETSNEYAARQLGES